MLNVKPEPFGIYVGPFFSHQIFADLSCFFFPPVGQAAGIGSWTTRRAPEISRILGSDNSGRMEPVVGLSGQVAQWLMVFHLGHDWGLGILWKDLIQIASRTNPQKNSETELAESAPNVSKPGTSHGRGLSTLRSHGKVLNLSTTLWSVEQKRLATCRTQLRQVKKNLGDCRVETLRHGGGTWCFKRYCRL